MADIKVAFSSTTNIVCTLTSLLASSSRECTAVDNSSNLYPDALLHVKVTTSSGTMGDAKAVYVWLYGSVDGAKYTDNATGSDADLVMRSPTNLRGPFVISTPTANVTYESVIGSVASFFGGSLPVKWGVVIENKTNVTLDPTASNFSVYYAGIYYTSI